MRIAVVETSAHGGLLHYAAQLADGLAAHDHEVDLLVPARNELTQTGVRSSGTSAGRGEARLCPVLVPQVRSASAPPRGHVAYQLRRGLVALRLLRSTLRVCVHLTRRRYDTVVLQWDITFPMFALATRLLVRLPARPAVAFVLHNVRPFNRWGGDELFLARPAVTRRVRGVLGELDLVVVHGQRSREEYERLWPPVPLAVIPHGDERLLAPEPPPPAEEARVLFFGDWRKVKGLPVLLEAFDRLLTSVPDARLTIAGTPAPGDFDDAFVHRWAARHGDRVELVAHYVPIDDVAALFARARVVCTPYLAGFQSGVVHLAMTMARAVVSSDVGDLPSVVVDGETGLVVAAGDAAALADALAAVLVDGQWAAAMGAAGHKRLAESASWEQVGGQLSAALEQAVRRR